MRIAILAPGPSLAGAIIEDADLRLAVNRAASFAECDWWVFGDAVTFYNVRPKGRPRLFLARQAWEGIERPETEGSWCPTTFEELTTDIPKETGWQRFSLTAALVLAEYLGAGRIDLYGCDWDGNCYFDGALDAMASNAYRWVNERHSYGRVCAWLGSRGVDVRRRVLSFTGIGNG